MGSLIFCLLLLLLLHDSNNHSLPQRPNRVTFARSLSSVVLIRSVVFALLFWLRSWLPSVSTLRQRSPSHHSSRLGKRGKVLGDDK